MAGFFDPVRPVEQGPGWNWNPGQTFVTAMNDAKKQQALLEKNQLDMELEQILMPYKVQKAALDLDKLQADTEYLAAHTALYREKSKDAQAARMGALESQGGKSRFSDEFFTPSEVPSGSPSASVSPKDQGFPDPAGDSGLPKELASNNPLTNLTDEVPSSSSASLFDALPAPGATVADNSEISATEVVGMEKNSAAIDNKKSVDFMRTTPASDFASDSTKQSLSESETALDKIAKSLPEPAQKSQENVPGKVFGYEVRQPSQSELDYFRKNPQVGGMAAEDGRIILNPASKLSSEEKAAVAKNEAARLYMRENGVVPDFELTPEQKATFAGTAYGTPENESALKSTIAARILSGDPSAGNVTADQKAFANDLAKRLEAKNSPQTPPQKVTAQNAGLSDLVGNYNQKMSQATSLIAKARASNNTKLAAAIKGDWDSYSQNYVAEAARRGMSPQQFNSLARLDQGTLKRIQDVHSKGAFGDDWDTPTQMVVAEKRAALKPDKPEKPNEQLNSLVYARKELAASIGEEPSPEAKANLAILDEKIKNAQRGITPDQAQQEKVTASRSYQLGEISKWIGGAEPEKKSALLNLNSLIEKGEIPTISLKQNKDGKMLYSKADQALLSKVEDGMPFAAVDASGTRQILRKDSNSGFGFSRWGKLGDTASATPASASQVSVSDANPLKESLQQIEQSKLVKAQAKEDEELADIERRMNFLSQSASSPSLNNPAAWGSQLVRGIAPESTTKNLSETWEKLNARKKQLLAAKATRTGK
jgi:hypothetical protein